MSLLRPAAGGESCKQDSFLHGGGWQHPKFSFNKENPLYNIQLTVLS